jgi:predicted AlkP superfamily pyrophosphatase or phosphodiesterase
VKFGCWLLTCALAACTPPVVSPASSSPEGAAPLVVLVVLDQWPEWAFEAKRPALTHGFERLLAEGEWHVGVYPAATTLTGPDHALLGTGAPPARSGILSDSWWHRDPGVLLESVHGEDGAITPKWLRVQGLGDVVAEAGGDREAIAVSLKPRAAILPLGHHGVSIWYDPSQAAWTSFAVPRWVADWNSAHPISAHFHDVWTPLDADELARLTGVPDDQPGESGLEGFGSTFPHDAGATPKPAMALFAMPVGNDLVIDTATRAIEARHLGHHHSADLLVIALSAHDYIGHAWGQESWEMWDTTLRLDARLDRLLADLDRLVGPGNWSMIVTADHGASPMPERIGGGRLKPEAMQLAANNAATAVLGDGRWIEDAHYPYVYFSKAMLAQPKDELESATKRVINALRSLPGIERVDRTAALAGRCDTRSAQDRAVCLMLDPVESGELFFLPAPGWIFEGAEGTPATAHGSPHDYDRRVPVIVLPPGRTRHEPAAEPLPGSYDMTEVAPQLARWLGVRAPGSPYIDGARSTK